MKSLLVVLAMAALATSAQAQTFLTSATTQNEIDVNLGQAQIHSYKIGDESYTDINVNLAYRYYLQSGFQVGGEGGISSWKEGTDNKTLFGALALGTYNFQPSVANSFFVGAGVGLLPAYDKDDGTVSSKFSFVIDVGRRFELMKKISYKPFLRIEKRGDMDMGFVVEAFNFAFFW